MFKEVGSHSQAASDYRNAHPLWMTLNLPKAAQPAATGKC